MKLGRILAWIFGLMALASCGEQSIDKSISEPRTYSDLCEFDGAILVQLVSKGQWSKYIECMQNGEARREKINSVLYQYLDEYIEPGAIIQCDSTQRKEPIIKNLIPPLESKQ